MVLDSSHAVQKKFLKTDECRLKLVNASSALATTSDFGCVECPRTVNLQTNGQNVLNLVNASSPLAI